MRSRLVVAAGLSALVASRAGALDARVGWRPVQNVAGYRLYVRLIGQVYGSGIDVGLLPADPDGVIRYLTHGLPTGVLNYFAVTAYDASGRESGFSNELSLLVAGAPPPTSTAAAMVPMSSRTPTASAAASRTSTASATAPRTPTATYTATPLPTRTPTPTATVSGPRYAVGGRITYYATGAPVPGTTLTLRGLPATLTAATDAAGVFGFSGVGTAIWQLQPYKQGDHHNGVTALDAAYILQRLAGMRDFDPLQTFACDVTGNGSLSALDAVRILEFAVGDLVSVPVAAACGSDWAFLPQPLLLPVEQVTLPVPGATGCLPGSVVFVPLVSDAPQQDFTAVLFGDCTGNWTGGTGAALRQLAGGTQARLGTVRPRPGGRWMVTLHIDGADSLEALEAHFGYDPSAATLEDVHLVGSASDALLHYRADTSGVVSIALASAQPLSTGTRPLVVFVLSAADPPQVRLLDAVVDDSPVGVAE